MYKRITIYFFTILSSFEVIMPYNLFCIRILNFKALSENSNVVVICCLYSYTNYTCLAVLVKAHVFQPYLT